MTAFAVVACYLIMAIFDAAMLIGTVYLINTGWNPWWMLLTFVVLAGNTPSVMLRIIKEPKA